MKCLSQNEQFIAFFQNLQCSEIWTPQFTLKAETTIGLKGNLAHQIRGAH